LSAEIHTIGETGGILATHSTPLPERTTQRAPRSVSRTHKEETHTPARTGRRSLGLPLVFLGSLGVCVIISVVLGFVMDAIYDNRALPGFSVGGYDISGMPLSDVPVFLDDTESSLELTIHVGDQTHSGTASQLGISIDHSSILTKVYGKSTQRFWIYRSFQPTSIPLDVAIDRNQFNSWLADNFPENYDQPINAGLTFNPTTGVYDITEPAAGTGIADSELASIQQTLATAPQDASFSLNPTPVDPDVGAAEASETQQWVNERLATKCSFTETAATSSTNEPIYTLTPLDIASMVTVTTSTADGLQATFTESQVTEFVNQTFPDKVNRIPEDSVVVLNHKGEEVRTIHPGVTGRTLSHAERLPNQILDCLMNAEDTVMALTFTEIPFASTQAQPTISPAPPGARHWADVDLSTQTVTLMNGSTPGATFVLSSGKPGMETPTGTFPVYAKTRIQSVSGYGEGEYYSYPGVRWLVWFKGNYGFHTAYWHDNFGEPVSHGCLNLREADAKEVFDWLARGDKVVIHD